MPTITNKTRKPLSIPLPGGRALHLGPGKTAEIAPKAAQHPPVQKLIDDGELELIGKQPKSKRRSGGTPPSARPGGTGFSGTGGVRHTGDR